MSFWMVLNFTCVPNKVASKCISLWQGSVLRRMEQYFILPYCLHTACEALEGTLEDCISNLLQVLVQHVNVRHDLMKQLQKKKKKVLILQHPQEARCLPHCGAVKWTWCPGGLKTLHKFIKVLVSTHSVDDPAVEVPSCGWSSWQPSFNNLVKYTSVFWWPGEKSCNTTQVWEEKLMLAWWSSGGVALLAVERPWCVCHRRMLSRAAHR